MKVTHACRHCGTKITFQKEMEAVDCKGCKRPWTVDAAGNLLKVYRPPDERKRRPWFEPRRR